MSPKAQAREKADAIVTSSGNHNREACLAGFEPEATFQFYPTPERESIILERRDGKWLGIPVTEVQISEWSSEAERGYDVEVLKKRGRGRPGRGATPTQIVAVRLTAAELALIDARAEKENKTRSEAIRAALAEYAA